jgi:hypothetical protein
MLIHLPDETPIIAILKLAASLNCEVEYSSASVLRFKQKAEGIPHGNIKHLPSQQQRQVGHGVRQGPR